jgi:uncharacterized protein (DUF362 family)
MNKIAVQKTSPESVLSDYRTLMHNADYQKALPQMNDTILKLNLSWSLYYPACSTEPWQLEGVLRTMLNDGYKNLYPVENRTVVTDVWKGARGNRWLPILERYHQKFYPLTETEWVKYTPQGSLLAIDRLFPDGHKIPKMYLGKNIVHLPTIKTHGHTQMTGAVKNAFGGLITERRHHSHKVIHEILVDLMTIQKEIHPGIFAVMDGTVCGDGKGPRTMIPVEKNYLIAGADQIAVDAVSAHMMGYDPMKIRFIKLAHDKGLGCGDIDQIDIVGEDISKINFHFHTEKSPVIFFDQLFRKGAFRSVEPLLFHTGLFQACVFASGFYHDHLWYPTVGKSRIRRFMRTPWGRLLRTY